MQTKIFKFTTPQNSSSLNSASSDEGHHERLIGFVENGTIYSTAGRQPKEVGRVDSDQHIFRYTRHDEQELGYVTEEAEITSHGLFEGGSVGWMEADGVVVQSGLILGEDEVGRVDGPESLAGAAALLLLFLPDDAEENRKMSR
ncbi:MAG: hypothetical protein AAF702_20930 [Chloroflexota bacterium]